MVIAFRDRNTEIISSISDTDDYCDDDANHYHHDENLTGVDEQYKTEDIFKSNKNEKDKKYKNKNNLIRDK